MGIPKSKRIGGEVGIGTVCAWLVREAFGNWLSDRVWGGFAEVPGWLVYLDSRRMIIFPTILAIAIMIYLWRDMKKWLAYRYVITQGPVIVYLPEHDLEIGDKRIHIREAIDYVIHKTPFGNGKSFPEVRERVRRAAQEDKLPVWGRKAKGWYGNQVGFVPEMTSPQVERIPPEVFEHFNFVPTPIDPMQIVVGPPEFDQLDGVKEKEYYLSPCVSLNQLNQACERWLWE